MTNWVNHIQLSVTLETVIDIPNQRGLNYNISITSCGLYDAKEKLEKEAANKIRGNCAEVKLNICVARIIRKINESDHIFFNDRKLSELAMIVLKP